MKSSTTAASLSLVTGLLLSVATIFDPVRASHHDGGKNEYPIKLTEDPPTETDVDTDIENRNPLSFSTDDPPTETDTEKQNPLTTSTAPPGSDNSNSNTPLWAEEFDYIGPPDASLWSYDVGGGGWGNGELQFYTNTLENAVVEAGILKIIARRNGDEFTSARIKTENKFAFTYGTLEARIRVPNMNAGLWPAFWTMGNNVNEVGWPKAGEVDILEMGQGLAIEEGLVNYRVVSAAHWDIFGQYATYARAFDSPIDLSLDFHIYRLEWTPEKMITTVDGNWIWEIDINETVCPSCQELHQPHHILLNMAVGGGFTSGGTSSSAASSSSSNGNCSGSSSSAGSSSSSGGCPSRGPDDITAPLPAELQVDWIRLYDNGYTVLTTKSPTNIPTAPPTLATPRQPDTASPTISPVTQPPQVATRAPLTPGSGKGGKGGLKSRIPGSGSRQSTSRDSKSKSKSTKVGSRQGASGGKGKGGKGGKGRWSRSGTTATGKGKGKGGSGLRDPATSAATGSPGVAAPSSTPPVSSTRSPGTPGTDFEPIDNSDGNDNTPIISGGPQSLVVDPATSGAGVGTFRSCFWSSLALTGLMALGIVSGLSC